MQNGYELFSIGTVSVKIHGSFVLLAILMILLAFSYGGEPADVGLRLLGPLVLFGTVILHELGHAAVARRLGVRVIDVLLTPLGGMARIEGELRDPREEGLIAVAGPAMNLLLAAVTFGFIAASGRIGELESERFIYFLEENRTFLQDDLLIVFFGLNLLLAVLNLIPAFPCDGGRVLRAVLSARLGRLQGTRAACRIGTWFSFGMILLPFFADGSQWWLAPIIGFFFIFACLKERLMVEAREGLGMTGRFFQFGGGFPNSSSMGFEQRRTEDDEALDDGNVIDITGTSRLVDDGDD